MAKDKYRLLLEEFVCKYKKLDIRKREAIFSQDTIIFSSMVKKQSILTNKYANKFKSICNE